MSSSLFDRTLASSPLPGRWRSRLGNAGIILAPVVLGGISGLSSAGEIRGWYRTIERPDWNPPDGVFGPVWTSLYLAMGVALMQVVRTPQAGREKPVALVLFATQLALNLGWSWIFFVQHDLGLALIEILAMWLAIAATAVMFGRIRRSAGLLLVPYLGWVTFATLLTASIWTMNRPS